MMMMSTGGKIEDEKEVGESHGMQGTSGSQAPGVLGSGSPAWAIYIYRQ